jgi:hypothetical protein
MTSHTSFELFLDNFLSLLITSNSAPFPAPVFFTPKDMRAYRYDIRKQYNLTPRNVSDVLKAFAMWYAVRYTHSPQKAVALQVRFGFRQYGDFCAFTKRTFSMLPSDVIRYPQSAQHNLLENYPVLAKALFDRFESLGATQNHSTKPQHKTTAQNHSTKPQPVFLDKRRRRG